MTGADPFTTSDLNGRVQSKVKSVPFWKLGLKWVDRNLLVILQLES